MAPDVHTAIKNGVIKIQFILARVRVEIQPNLENGF
jgi:hypothetical protein|tara:strand:+ start:464 stop:571 length:108 start_codon:yes stop_codon:yes gene_type:complete